MDEEAKKRVAEFRFGVIHDLIGDRKLERGQRKLLLQEKSACEWDIPHSGRSRLSISTILSWARRYEKGEDDWRAFILTAEVTVANQELWMKKQSLPCLN